MSDLFENHLYTIKSPTELCMKTRGMVGLTQHNYNGYKNRSQVKQKYYFCVLIKNIAFYLLDIISTQKRRKFFYN